MKGDIYRLSENEEETFTGEKMGTIVCIGGKCVLHTEDDELKDIVEPLLQEKLFVKSSVSINGTFSTIKKYVTPTDPEFMKALRSRLLSFGLWLEIEE